MSSLEPIQNIRPAPPAPAPVPGNGNGTRLRALEERLARIEAILPYLATREDLQKEINRLLRWLIGVLITSVLALVAAVLRSIAGT